MKIRKLEDRRGLEKPDRTNASWQKSASQKSSSQKEVAPEEGPPRPDENPSETLPQIPKKTVEAPLVVTRQASPETLETDTDTSLPIPAKPFEAAAEQSEPAVVRKRVERSRKGVWNDESERVETKAPIWLIGTIVLTLLGSLGLLLFKSLNQSEDHLATVLPPENTIDSEIAEMDLGPVSEVMPHEVAMSFAMTADPQERLKHCRNPKQVAALIPEFSPQAVSEVGVSGSPMDESIIHGLEVKRFKVLLEGGDARIIFVVRTDEGPKVDWEAYAMHSQDLKRWVREAENTPQSTRAEETAEVRVFAMRDSYYNYRFAEEGLWHAYKIGNADLGTAVTAYAKADSTTAKILRQEVLTEKRLTLQLRSRPEDARSGQYEIEKVLAIDWVEPDHDFEEAWQRKNLR